ncbi:ImmA/IrrE family metallo-endopeptidase [Eubacterium multiforme]|uniref:Zn-dependent peptidase ImmA (M78 family) n=1 Tax=Eubacterium multiforme TaxID=83339 RepID=A0ABT9US66_9FIRM|nr:ImmA/IrrE family metallo-endopeptidase [Eubacterium multiforme]MDQ0149160.1 Zn-dependent peptidase ImmA (M78 family) [Eubacterium multiforme]
MKSLTDIYNLIEKENLILEEVNFKEPNIEGIYFKVPGLSPTIGIHKNIVHNTKKYISVLAEELGHHFTSIGDLTAECVTYAQKLNRSKQELRARRFAANYLISDDEIIGAILQNINTIYGLSSYFNVTEEIIKYKLLSIYLKEGKYTNSILAIMTKEVVYDCCNL